MDLEIEGRQTALRPEWRSDIESRVADLHRNPEITHIRVTLTKHDHRKPADSHSVLLVVQIPGHTITAAKHHETFDEAIRLTFEALGLELDRIHEKRTSHEVHVSEPPERGIVTKLFPDKTTASLRSRMGLRCTFTRMRCVMPPSSKWTAWK